MSSSAQLDLLNLLLFSSITQYPAVAQDDVFIFLVLSNPQLQTQRTGNKIASSKSWWLGHWKLEASILQSMTYLNNKSIIKVVAWLIDSLINSFLYITILR